MTLSCSVIVLLAFMLCGLALGTPESEGFSFESEMDIFTKEHFHFGLYRRKGSHELFIIKQPEYANLTKVVRQINKEIENQKALLAVDYNEEDEIPIVTMESYGNTGEDKDLPWIAYKYYEHGDLQKMTTKIKRRFTIAEIRIVAHRVLTAMQLLKYALSSSHQDIKLSNIVVTDVDYRGFVKDVKVIDLEHTMPSTSKPYLYGTIKYTSPDYLAGALAGMLPQDDRAATEKTENGDIWALGIVLYQLMTKQEPYKTFQLGAPFKTTRENYYATIGVQYTFSMIQMRNFDHCYMTAACDCETLKDLLMSMFELHPEQRITIEDALAHMFFDEGSCQTPVAQPPKRYRLN